MSKTSTLTLDEAVAKAKELPQEQQEALGAHLGDLVREVQEMPERTPKQLRMLQERLNEPFVEAPREAVEALHNRYAS